uniref:Uncharacterized protein n=1 Tax=Fagus sylvatica TaxID=28930 RepID=A0A2N9G017_FAGSY
MFLLGQGVNPLSSKLMGSCPSNQGSTNTPWHQRSVCTNEDAEVIILEGLSKITAVKVEPFRIVSDALPLFTSWWEALMLRDVNTTSSEAEETVNARPLQTVLPSPKRSTRVKQRAAKKATKAKKQPIKTERQEITALSIKAHQDAVSIITKEIPVHLSSPEKKQKLAAEKERAVKIKQEQTLQVEAAMEAKKKAIHDEEEKRRIELERRQKEELDAKRRAKIEHRKQKEEEAKEKLRKEKKKRKERKEMEKKAEEEKRSTATKRERKRRITKEIISNQLEVKVDPLIVPTIPSVEKTKEETTTPVTSTPEIEIIEQTPEDVDQSTALVLATLTPDAKPLSQQPLLDTQIIKVDIEDLTSSKTPASPVSQGMSAVVVMRSILEQPLDNLVYDSELRNRFQESTDFLLSQSNFLNEDMLEIQSIQKGYDEKITAKSEFQQEFEQTLKKYEDTKQEISKVRKELQRLENVKDLTQ